MLKKLALLLGASIAALLVGECIARILIVNPIANPEQAPNIRNWRVRGLTNDDLLGFSFEPGFEGRMILDGDFDVPFRINDQGLRDDIVYGSKPPGRKRILLIGDSFVFGIGVELSDTLGKQLESRLNRSVEGGSEQAVEAPVDVVAVGCPGYGLDHYVRLIERWVPQVEPDLVVVCVFPGNDIADYDTRESNPRSVVDGFLVHQDRAWSYALRRRSTLAHMVLSSIDRYRAGAGNVSFGKKTPEEDAREFESTLEWVDALCQTQTPDGPPLAVAMLFGKSAIENWKQGKLGSWKRQSDALCARIRAGGATVLDPKQMWIDAPGSAERYFHVIDPHYSVAGNHALAEFIAAEVRGKRLLR